MNSSRPETQAFGLVLVLLVVLVLEIQWKIEDEDENDDEEDWIPTVSREVQNILVDGSREIMRRL